METRLADRLVVTRMDTSKLGWTPYVYYTTLHSTPPYIYWARELLEKRVNLGEIRVRDKMSFCKKRGFRKQEDWVQRPRCPLNLLCRTGKRPGRMFFWTRFARERLERIFFQKLSQHRYVFNSYIHTSFKHVLFSIFYDFLWKLCFLFSIKGVLNSPESHVPKTALRRLSCSVEISSIQTSD